MITPKERADKIKKAPSNSGRWLKSLSKEKHDERLQHALHHDNDAGLSSTDEYVYLHAKEVNGR